MRSVVTSMGRENQRKALSVFMPQEEICCAQRVHEDHRQANNCLAHPTSFCHLVPIRTRWACGKCCIWIFFNSWYSFIRRTSHGLLFIWNSECVWIPIQSRCCGNYQQVKGMIPARISLQLAWVGKRKNEKNKIISRLNCVTH